MPALLAFPFVNAPSNCMTVSFTFLLAKSRTLLVTLTSLRRSFITRVAPATSSAVALPLRSKPVNFLCAFFANASSVSINTPLTLALAVFTSASVPTPAAPANVRAVITPSAPVLTSFATLLLIASLRALIAVSSSPVIVPSPMVSSAISRTATASALTLLA